MQTRSLNISRSHTLGAVAAIALFAFPGSARANIMLTFDPQHSTIFGVQTVTIQLVVDADATDLRGFSLSFAYDPGVVDLVSVDPGALLTGAACPHFFERLNPTVTGVVEVDGAGLGCSVVGPGSIVELTFMGKNLSGATALALDCADVRMRGSANEFLDVDCVDGSIRTVYDGIAVEPDTWGRVKSLYR